MSDRIDQPKRALIQATGIGMVVAATGLSVGAEAADVASPAKGADPTRIDRHLHDGWTFRQAGTSDWLRATVPGTVHTDLFANGRIGDPFYRNNEADQQWIDKENWEYRTTFDVDDAVMACRRVELFFEGLDTFAEVYVNDRKIISADNMFREWRADVRPMITSGSNTLRILFVSPITVGRRKLAELGYNLPSTNDQSERGGVGEDKLVVFARKAQYHYGWDWGPRFVTSGVWRPVHLIGWNDARIGDLQIVQNKLGAASAALTGVVEVEAERAGPATVTIGSPSGGGWGAARDVVLKAGLNRVEVPFTIASPKLWWCNGLGDPHLYSVRADVRMSGRICDSRSLQVGLRTIRVVRTPDKLDSSFYFELNGVPVFMKGANAIPNDSFLPRVTPAVHQRVVQAAVDANMNMLRVWGGGIYEDDAFYDACDRKGILVWQDFMFACAMYPGDEPFLANVRQEAVDNMRRLRNHPCIALWCGNNEIDTGWQHNVPDGGWLFKSRYSKKQQADMWRAYEAVFHEMLPQLVSQLDSNTFYWASSPMAAEGKHQDFAAHAGDIHYWDVWWGQEPFDQYRTKIGRFMSEFGFQSFPEYRTIASYTTVADRDIFSDVMKGHQRSPIGNTTIKKYMERDYPVPADFRQFLYVGQVLQAEGVKIALEAHRARMPYNMGSLYWQINDCWPVASWSSMDYYGRRKGLHHFAAKAFAPMLVTPQTDGKTVRVHVVSDRLADSRGTLTLSLVTLDGRTLWKERHDAAVRANTSTMVLERSHADLLKSADPKTVVLLLDFAERGRPVASNTFYFAPVKALVLPQPDVRRKVVRRGDRFAVTLSSQALVKNLYLDTGTGDGRFSDNYFDLAPGETRTIDYVPAGGITARGLEQTLTMTHMAMIRDHGRAG